MGQTVTWKRVGMRLPRLTTTVQKAFNLAGFRIIRVRKQGNEIPWDMDLDFKEIFNQTLSYSMTSTANRYAMHQAAKYVVRYGIPGDIVECGVWRGGSSMIAARTLLSLGDTSRRLWLYDTFEGMTEPADVDVQAYDGADAHSIWATWKETHGENWAYSPLEEVKANLASTGYLEDKLVYVQGKVEDTLPANAPHQIALLRLDTDWFQSTYQELNHLFPRLSKHGILIIDDYGWWKGCREATDQHFQENNTQVFLNRVDSSCRLVIKSQ